MWVPDLPLFFVHHLTLSCVVATHPRDLPSMQSSENACSSGGRNGINLRALTRLKLSSKRLHLGEAEKFGGSWQGEESRVSEN